MVFGEMLAIGFVVVAAIFGAFLGGKSYQTKKDAYLSEKTVKEKLIKQVEALAVLHAKYDRSRERLQPPPGSRGFPTPTQAGSGGSAH